jgi:hypothetical protein
MPRPIRLFAIAALTGIVTAQRPAGEPAVDPMQLVSRAEPMFAKGEVEDAILLLWQAIVALRDLPDNPVHEVTELTARHLLREHDPLDEERRKTFASIAKQQVDLANAYRGRKWFDTAATRIDVADQYDRDQAAKARAALEAARAKEKPATTVAKPAAPNAPDDGPSQLLRRNETTFVSGDWRAVEDRLAIPPHDGKEGNLREWVCKSRHEDNEVIVEFRSDGPIAAHNIGIGVGLEILDGEASYSGYRAICSYLPGQRVFDLYLWQLRGMQFENLGNATSTCEPTTDGWHRFAVQVRGNALRLQVDGGNALEAATKTPVRGQVGLLHGQLGQPSCAVQVRNFRVDPLPADMPSDDQLRAQRQAELQQSVAAAVDEAKSLKEQKQPEPAAMRLRQAMSDLGELPPGLLHDNLGKAIEQMLSQTDPLAARRKKTSQNVATELVALADRYAEAKMVRAAHAVVAEAARFDPAGTAQRLTAAVEAVRAWNLAQLAARTAELAPPADDGTLLREWFAAGHVLDNRSPPWKVDGPSARVEQLATGQVSVLMPKQGMPPLQRAAVHVRLPTIEATAGLCFDVVGLHDYATAFLRRDERCLWLHVYRFAGSRWTELKRVRIAMDLWRLDAWHEVALERTPAGITVRAAGQVWQLANTLLRGVDNGFGLYAGSSAPEPVTIELRAFRLGP